jgi:hypothetical protein
MSHSVKCFVQTKSELLFLEESGNVGLRKVGRVWDPNDMKFKDLMVDDSLTEEEIGDFIESMNESAEQRPDNN